jgi:hypothetical protein
VLRARLGGGAVFSTAANKKRKMTISADEFLCRFLLHALPRGRPHSLRRVPGRGHTACAGCNSPGSYWKAVLPAQHRHPCQREHFSIALFVTAR